MIKISKATNKDHLDKEWDLMDLSHYGKTIEWVDKEFKYKAIENNELLGIIEGRIEADVVYISGIITKQNARGRGIGKMLIEKTEEFGKKLGARKTWLITGKDWSENTFYKKLGFKFVGNVPDLYFHTDFVVYTRDIT